MWYSKNYRRHLCDMHIDDWNDEFLSEFSPEDYFENLKKANVQNAMLYFQSHVGLSYYPTRSGKMHNAFKGREDAMKRLFDMCRKDGIKVTGYYSLVFNNWAHDTHPEWRMVRTDGKSQKESCQSEENDFARNDVCRYGRCCPNNMEYRAFTAEQLREIVDYFEFDGMFFDMLFWSHPCYCKSCQERWRNEVGGEIPTVEDWSDPRWLLHMRKRCQWMGEFAQFATDEIKKLAPHVSVEHNGASLALPLATRGHAEEVLNATDYVGGDLYGDLYKHSFVCKLYRNATKNQPFEYMFSRCTPTLSTHTVTKSEEEMTSAVLLTAAHHGATLVIDAIDPVGTLDSRLYDQFGRAFDEEMKFEKYFEGDMIEDVGFYYSLRSKFRVHGESYCNHDACVNAVKTMIVNHVTNGVTGTFHPLEKYQVLAAPYLTEEDSTDYQRIIDYVKDGGQLYLSGGECHGLLKEFFGAEVKERTKEKVVYIAPEERAMGCFEYFNKKYPLHFDGTAPIVQNIDEEKVVATITLPYTRQDELKFAAIHSNPPGIPTKIPAMAVTEYGKGKVFWSALTIESMENHDYRRIFMNLLNQFFEVHQTIGSDAPADVEITGFCADEGVYVNAVLLNEDYKAHKAEPFFIEVRCMSMPKAVLYLPEEEPVEFRYTDGKVIFVVDNLEHLNMYKIIL